MNRLVGEKSAYLKHSAHQKIDWYPWSDEAFEKARSEDKPVFLSSGAVWCHWCHVMAKECFENEEIARILNESFINIKLDRDERPDIDRRLQQAVAAMGAGGGWPLTVFLTPDKKPFFGGTYFPPEDMHGRPGFKKVLRSVADFYKSKKTEVAEYTGKLMDFLQPKPMLQEDIKESALDEAVEAVLSEFDPQNGGFGTQPKFQMPGALEFLINRFSLTGNETIGYAAKKTLESMAKGGFHDQIGGGFHRYSVDEAWIIPHFEKMADDNAWLLRNYINAYSVFGDAYFKEVAEGIIDFVRNVLSDPEGGFYTSQDADVTPDDEGGYFTWTDEDFRRILTDEQYGVLSLRLLHERGSMHHDRSKKVLFIATEVKEIADKSGRDVETIAGIINEGKKKLLEERRKREMPFIDKTLYTSLNGMLISSLLLAFRAIGDTWSKDFALKSLDRIIRERYADNRLSHSEGVNAFLDDYIYLSEALVNAYEITCEQSYIELADMLMEQCIEKLWDRNEGGFFDSGEDILGVKLKAVEDIPHPSANAAAIILMLKLHLITNKRTYLQYAEKALKVFSGRAKDMGIHSGYYFCAVDSYFNMLKFTLYSRQGSELTEALIHSYTPHTCITYGEDRGYVLPCSRSECYEPLQTVEEMNSFIRKYGGRHR